MDIIAMIGANADPAFLYLLLGVTTMFILLSLLLCILGHNIHARHRHPR